MTDAEIVALVLAEAKAAAMVTAACEAYDEAPTGHITESVIGPLHEAWMQARAACRLAVLDRMEAMV